MKVYINGQGQGHMTKMAAMAINTKNLQKSSSLEPEAKGLKFYDLKKKLTPGVALTRSWGYIHVYYHSSQTSLLVYISGFR